PPRPCSLGEPRSGRGPARNVQDAEIGLAHPISQADRPGAAAPEDPGAASPLWGVDDEVDMYVRGSVFGALSDCAQIFDRTGACIYANRAAAACLGLTPSSMIGKTWRELGLAGESTTMEARREVVFSTGAPLIGEVLF